MDQREQENPSQPSSNVNSKEDQPPRKPPAGNSVGGGGGSDRIKRDEWSEGAVATLLEAYESKWILRNRAKLKGQDWEDVARYVSSRVNNTKSPKTQTQCKNKIESMKKRYRSESTTADHQHQTSSWPLFSRLDHLLRGTGTSGSGVPTTPPPSSVPQPEQPLTLPAGPTTSNLKNPTFILVESGPVPPQPPPAPPLVIEMERSPQFNCPDQIAKEDRAIADETRVQNQASDKKTILDTDSTSTPALYDNNENDGRDDKRKKMKVDLEKRKRRRRGGDDHDHDHDRAIAESIQWLAEVVVRSEQARMDTIRELERMRIEAEAKRGEMDLKRTEIIANTQLEIARLFASSGGGGGGNKKH